MNIDVRSLKENGTESVNFIVEQGPSDESALKRKKILEQFVTDLYREINLTDTRQLRQHHKDAYDEIAKAVKVVVDLERKLLR